MMTNHRQLEVTQEQLQQLAHALAELRHAAAEAECRGQAPPVVEHIRRLREEIDAYLGISGAEFVAGATHG